MDEFTLHMLDLHTKGYCCSQIMFIMALELQGKTNPDLIRSVKGLCQGIGYSGHVCGTLSGGVCLLSLYTGKGVDEEAAHEKYAGMVTDFIFWFQKESSSANCGILCSDILSRHDRSICATLVKTSYNKVMEILTANGIDTDRNGE